MKKYRIIPENLTEKANCLAVLDGFSVMKVSEEDALRAPQGVARSTSFEASLRENGITNYSPLAQGEKYNGFVAVWKGYAVKFYWMYGSLSIYPVNTSCPFAEPLVRELIKEGKMLDTTQCNLRYLPPICTEQNCLNDEQLVEKFREAILTKDKIIYLEEELKDRLIRSWYHTFQNALREVPE